MRIEPGQTRSKKTATPSCPHGIAASVLPPGVEVVEGPVADYIGQLLPAEWAVVAEAVPARRHEFSTGRAFARQALERVGLEPTSIPRRPDRAPEWPAGIVGSIAHTRGYCAVGVGSTARYAAIGLDVEVESDVDRSLGGYVVSEFELVRLQETGMSRDLAVAIAFSAKEAFYKCQFRITRRALDFLDVAVELDSSQEFFRITPLASMPELGGDPLPKGRVHRCCGLIATGMVLPCQGPAARDGSATR